MNVNMEILEKCKQDVCEALYDDSKPWFPIFDWIEQKAGVPRLYTFIGCIGFVVMYLAFGYGAQILCNVIGIAYPAYISIHAIETSSKEDDTKWLTYWVTFACLTLLEPFSIFLLSIIPFYYLVKCVFLVWCMLPCQNNGSNIIYHSIILPYFLNHHEAVDKVIDSVKGSVENVIRNKSNTSAPKEE